MLTYTPKTNDIGFLIKLIHDDIVCIINNQLRPVDLTSTQAVVLTYLSANDNSQVTMREIQKALSVAHPTIVGLIKRMDKKGLVEVSTAADDHRMRIVRLTDKARDVLSKFQSHADLIESLLLNGLTHEECRELQRMLTILHGNVQ